MSKENTEEYYQNMEEFYQELSQNRKWQEKLKKARDIKAFTKVIAELGKEKGYTFTSEQVRIATTEKIKNEVDVWGEIPDEELEAVARGRLGFWFPDFPFLGKWCVTSNKMMTNKCS